MWPTLHCGLACSRDTEEENERPAIFFGRRINFHVSDRGRVSPMDFVLTKTALVVYGSVLQLSLCTTVTSIDVRVVCTLRHWSHKCHRHKNKHTLFSSVAGNTFLRPKESEKSQSALQARDEMARVKYLREKPLDCFFFRWKLLFTACPSSSVTAKN